MKRILFLILIIFPWHLGLSQDEDAGLRGDVGQELVIGGGLAIGNSRSAVGGEQLDLQVSLCVLEGDLHLKLISSPQVHIKPILVTLADLQVGVDSR